MTTRANITKKTKVTEKKKVHSSYKGEYQSLIKWLKVEK